jgi:hypothetical protein
VNHCHADVLLDLANREAAPPSDDWADSGWTDAQATAIRAALVSPDTPTSPTDTGDTP